MKRSSVAFVLSVLLLALLPRESFAVITIYIHPNGAGANAVFEISGQFDNPNAMDSPTGLSSFAIAPLSMWRGPYPNNYTFASPLATVYNVTRNTSGDLPRFNA